MAALKGEDMEISIQHLPSTVVVTMSGMFGTAEVDHMLQQVREVMATTRLDIVLEGSQLRFIDSSGLGCLVTLAKDARQKRQRFVLAAFPGHIREVLVMTRLDQLLTIHEGSVQDYVRSRES
ncbi:MAG: STAS domain-containing protein [Deltaproteobacteria bacterium]|nr:STAS domain-containing protein [Candidatus Anaeroferrophillacea bacterium]